MLRPNKHSHPDRTVLNTALVILVRLRTRRLVQYDALLSHIRKAVKGGEFLFLPALNLLFLLGLVTYRSKTDSFEYTENQ